MFEKHRFINKQTNKNWLKPDLITHENYEIYICFILSREQSQRCINNLKF